MITTEPHLPRSNALKNMLLGVADVTCCIVFILFWPVDWAAAAPMAAGFLAGSMIGPSLTRHIPGHIQLPHHRSAVVPQPVHRFPGRAGDRARAVHLPAARDRRVDDLGAMAVQPARARLELPAVVPVATLHRLPQPPARPALRTGYRRTQMAQDRCPVLEGRFQLLRGLPPTAERSR